MQQYIGFFFIFLAAACWGFLGPAGRIAMEEGLAPVEVSFWRALFACVFFLLHAAKTHTLKLRFLSDLKAFALFGLISLATLFACYQYAVQSGGAALASVLLYTSPAWVAVFARIFLNEPLTIARLAAIAMALSGVIFVSFSGGDSGLPATSSAQEHAAGGFPVAGIVLGLLCGLVYSSHYIFAKKYLTHYTAVTLYGYSLIFAILGMLPFVSQMPPTPKAWGAVLFLASIGTYVGYWAYCEGLKRLSSTKAAVLGTLEPLVATLVAWWLWGEHFSGSGWIGVGLILGAVLVLVLEPQKSPVAS